MKKEGNTLPIKGEKGKCLKKNNTQIHVILYIGNGQKCQKIKVFEIQVIYVGIHNFLKVENVG